jgi:hypothetical protein
VDKFTDPGDDSDASKSLELDKGPSKKVASGRGAPANSAIQRFQRRFDGLCLSLQKPRGRSAVEGSVV